MVTDNIGCTGSKAVILNSTSAINLSDSIVSAQCKGIDNGAIYINALGNYDYFWSTGSNTIDLIDIATGEYTLMVRDKTGCAAVYNYIVNTVQDLILTETHTNESFPGAADGSAMISVASGTAPYQFLWNTNPNQFTGSATTLTAGPYHCTVTDSVGCFEVIGVNID